MLQLHRRYLHTSKRTPTFGQIVVTRQCIKRERVSIQMIFKIKDTGEPCAGEFGLIPGAVRILLLEEPRDSSFNRRIVWTCRRQEADQAPRRLRGSALPFSLERGIVVGKDRLAESAVAILDGTQPVGSALAIRLIGNADLFERS